MKNFFKGIAIYVVYLCVWFGLHMGLMQVIGGSINRYLLGICITLVTAPLFVWKFSPYPVELSIYKALNFLNRNPAYWTWGLLLFLTGPISVIAFKMIFEIQQSLIFSPWLKLIDQFGWIVFPYAFFLSPVITELLLRQTVYATMTEDLEGLGKVIATIVLSAIVALAQGDIVFIPASFVSQLMQCYLYEKSGNINVPIVAAIIDSALLCFFGKI